MDTVEQAAETDGYVLVRATVNLPYGLERGTEIYVSVENERIQQWLECEWMIPVGEPDELPRDA